MAMIRIRFRIKQPNPDQYQVGKQDPDPYQSEKHDRDPCQKGLDPQQWLIGINLKIIPVIHGAVENRPEAGGKLGV
jgi:hypothetical protein